VTAHPALADTVPAAGQVPANPVLTDTEPGMRLVQADLTAPGFRRRRCGRGFRYFAADGKPLTDARALARVKDLVIPPAWEDVWISPHPRGHIQAVGTDAAGRRQYMYHQLWRERRDRQKFDRVMEFGRALPRVRAVVERHLRGPGLSRDRVLAAAVRLIDLDFFRPGGEEYAAENGSFGLATIRREHVTCGQRELTFEYTGKSGKHREQAVVDEQVCAVVRSLKRRRSGGDDLLVYRSGGRWHNVTAGDINDYLREVSGGEFTAKDFRTWHATVLAAVGLAVSEAAATGSPPARKRAVARVVKEVSGYLGNTPAVARASYIDPRVIACYDEGTTIAPMLADLGKGQEFGDVATNGLAERAVLKMLTGSGTVQRPRPAARLPVARPLGGPQGVDHQHRDRHRPDAARNRRDPPGDAVHLGRPDVAGQAGRGAVDADVDDGGTGLDVPGPDKPGDPGRDHQDVGRPGHLGQVGGVPVGDGDGRVPLQQQLGHRAADQLRAADDDRPGTRGGHPFGVEQLDDAARGARTQADLAAGQQPGAAGGQPVDVLGGRDPLDQRRAVQPFGQRQLQQDAGHGRVGRQLVEHPADLVLGGVGRQLPVQVAQAGRERRAALAGDVDGAGGVVTDQHGRQSRRPAGGERGGDLLSDLGADPAGHCLSVNQGGHGAAPVRRRRWSGCRA
jgi:DNA topoisomerase IB